MLERIRPRVAVRFELLRVVAVDALRPVAIRLLDASEAIYALHSAVVSRAYRSKAIQVAVLHGRGTDWGVPRDAVVLESGLSAINALRPRVVRYGDTINVVAITRHRNIITLHARAVKLASLRSCCNCILIPVLASVNEVGAIDALGPVRAGREEQRESEKNVRCRLERNHIKDSRMPSPARLFSSNWLTSLRRKSTTPCSSHQSHTDLQLH